MSPPGGSTGGVTINYSRKGLLVETDSFHAPGTEVIVTLENSPFADNHDPEAYCAVVRHCRELEDSSFRYGCGLELKECFGSAVFTPKGGIP